MVSTCATWASVWETLVPFMRCLSTTKSYLPSCRWECCCVFFYLERYVLAIGGCFITNKSFVFFLFSLIPENDSLVLFFYDISTLILILLIWKFSSWPSCKSFICFQFHHSIPLWYIYFFFNFILILLLFNFF